MYRNLNDNEILYMVSENNDDTFNILYLKYQPLIYKMMKKFIPLFRKYGYTIDDLMQIGYITLYKTSYLYSNYSHSVFYSYLKQAICNAIINEIRLNTTNRKKVLNEALSYDIEIPNSDNLYRDLFSSPINKNISRYMLTVFKNSMTYQMGNIFEMLLNGYKLLEIEILLDISKKELKEDITRIKNHSLTYKGLFFEYDMIQLFSKL